MRARAGGWNSWNSGTSIARRSSRALRIRELELREVNARLEDLSQRDPLTQLFNRRYFYAEAERLLAEGCKINLALFDLDEFKKVNDSYGHLAGDQILRDVGALFLRDTRADDLIARYGGDEFVLVATQATLDEVVALAGRLNAEIARLRWTFAEEKVRVGATAGVASSTTFEVPTLGQLLAACDRDLYKNKRHSAHPSDVKRHDSPPQFAAK